MRDVESRGCITIVMWLSYLGLVYISLESVGAWAALIAFVVTIPLFMGMGMIWNMFGNEDKLVARRYAKEEETEKRKRDRLDAVLRDLSDDELRRLQQRLQDGAIDDEVLYEQIVGDDGELLQR